MTIMQLFNEQLKNLPTERDRLINYLSKITYYDENWNIEMANQALRIVRSEKFELNTYNSNGYPHAELKAMNHFFSFEECSIEDMDVVALEKYVQSLLTELNKCSDFIEFILSGKDEFNPKDNGRIFMISCTF